MKRLAVLGLCLCLFPYCTVTAYADFDAPTETDGAVISVVIPETHTITIESNVAISLNDEKGTVFDVERLSKPILEIHLDEGEEIVKAVLNGEDITDKIIDGKYQFSPVYENLVLKVETRTAGTTPSKTETKISSETSVQTETSSKSNTVLNAGSPKTGDNTPKLISAMLASSGILIVLRKKKD